MPVRLIRDRLHTGLFQLLISLLQYAAYYVRRLSVALETLVRFQLDRQRIDTNMSGQITIVQNPISPTLRLKLRKAPKNPPGPENQQPVTIDTETLNGLLKIADKNGNLKVNITANGHITNGCEQKSFVEPSAPPRKKNKKRGKKGGKQAKLESTPSIDKTESVGTDTVDNCKIVYSDVPKALEPQPKVIQSIIQIETETVPEVLDKEISEEIIILHKNEAESSPVISQVIIVAEPNVYGNTNTGAFALMKKEFEEKDKIDKEEISVKTSLDKVQSDFTPVLHLKTTIPISPTSSLRHATVHGVPKQTRYVTTLFEVTGSRLSMFLSDIEEELKFWTGRELVICCEVYWSQPATNSRNRQLEHAVRSAVNRPMISAKYELAKRLQLHSIPNSITEEFSSSGGIAVPGIEVGIYRQYTPKLVEMINEDTTDRHSEVWAFDPHETPVQKLLKSHGAGEMRKNSILAVNVVTLQF